MKFWLIVTLTIAIQESASCSLIIMSTYQNSHISLLWVSLIFLITTVIEIPLFYSIGNGRGKLVRWVLRTKLLLWILNSNGFKFLKNWALYSIKRTEKFVGPKEQKIFVFYLSATAFPAWFSAIVFSRLKITFRQLFFLILSGVIIWYTSIVLIVVGLDYLVTNAKLTLTIIIASLFFYAALKKIVKKKWNKVSSDDF